MGSRANDPGVRIGVYRCWSCEREVPVKKKKSGKLSLACPWCDFPHYANPETEHYQRVMSDVRLDQVPEASPPAADPTLAPPDPAPAPERAPPDERSFASPLFGGRREVKK
jgi:hypothetical protein